jgi:hypothetical protein
MAERNIQYDEYGERLYTPEMIHWLEDKPQDVWADIVTCLNWDSAERVLQWMVERPDCERVIAAQILWGTDITRVLQGDGYEPWRQSFAGQLAMTIIRNARNGFYRSSRLRLGGVHDQELAAAAERWRKLPAARKSAHPEIDVPAELLGPFKGRAARPWPQHRPQHNPYVWDLLYGLGTSVGMRPGWGNLYNVYLLSDWRIVLGAAFVLFLLMVAGDALLRLLH